jgi:hypothetical protein
LSLNSLLNKFTNDFGLEDFVFGVGKPPFSSELA